MSTPVIARAALVVTAVLAVLLLASWQRDSDTCADAVEDILFAIRDRADVDSAAARVKDECEGSGRLVDAGAVLFQEGHPRQAEDVLREAVEREPESFSAWAGLASVLADGDPAASAEAATRAKELNPFYRPPS